jgi:hypothetical protein
VPDIVQIKAQYDQGSDGSSNSVNCPLGYIAIGISCDSSNDRGPDTCRFNPKSNQGNITSGQQFPKIGNGDNNFATGASVSRDGNTGTESVQVLLTCMRYQGFETGTLIDSEISPVVTGQQCAPVDDYVWKPGSCDYSGKTTTGRARIVYKNNRNVVFRDNACLGSNVQRLPDGSRQCLIVSYGNSLRGDGGGYPVGDCILQGQDLMVEI